MIGVLASANLFIYIKFKLTFPLVDFSMSLLSVKNSWGSAKANTNQYWEILAQRHQKIIFLTD
jgi:hypothetical protein